MKKFIKIIHIFVLSLILFFGGYFFIVLNGNQSGQFMVGVSTSIAYSIWGFLYHHLTGGIHRKIVIEYILISIIVIILLKIMLQS
jgi:hypothetical protein